MRITKKFFYALLLLVIILFSNVIFFLLSQPRTPNHSNNEIVNWTKGSLREDMWVSYDKTSFVGNDPFPTDKNILYWVVEANSTTFLVAESRKTVTHEGLPAREIENFFIYTQNEWLIFPFTIQLPELKEFYRENSTMQDLEVVKRWDSFHIKYKMVQEEKTKSYRWILDEDTRIAEKIKVTIFSPDKPKKGFIMEYKESSFFVGDEHHIILSYLGFIGLFVGCIQVAYIIYTYKAPTQNIVQKEKETLQSEEYKDHYMKQYTEKEEK